jgi:RHS repeat-associated protein
VGRCKYAGSYGYEWGMIHLWGANEDLPPILLLHVGERWYQPGIGRFIQRDPIGIAGGLNVYAYCESDPAGIVDPLGLAARPPTSQPVKRRINWHFVVHAVPLAVFGVGSACVGDVVCTVFIGWVPGSGYRPGDCVRAVVRGCKECATEEVPDSGPGEDKEREENKR